MFCERCGGKVGADDRACMHCGNMLKKDTNPNAGQQEKTYANGRPVPPRRGESPQPRQGMPPRQGAPEPPRGGKPPRQGAPEPTRGGMPPKKVVPNKQEGNKSSVWLILCIVFAVLICMLIGLTAWLSLGTGSKSSSEITSSEEVAMGDETGYDSVEVIVNESRVIEGNVELDMQEESDTATDDEYIFPDADSEYLTASEVARLSDDELRLARNEFYARHGRIFDSEDLQDYFESKSWYVPIYTAEEMDEMGLSIFNEYEIANIELIVEEESSR